MSGGKSGGTTIQTADLTPEQKAQIRAQTDFFTSTIAPAYQQAVGGAQDVYKNIAPGVGAAAREHIHRNQPEIRVAVRGAVAFVEQDRCCEARRRVVAKLVANLGNHCCTRALSGAGHC